MVRKVFHIEDSEVSRRYLKDLMRDVAPSVELVAHSSAMQAALALERLPDSELPGLILADHGLPQLDGTQFVSWVKMHPRLRSIPVVMVSAEADEHRKKKLKAMGVVRCLDKPVQSDQLSVTLLAAETVPATPEISREGALLFTEEAMDRIGKCEDLLNGSGESTPGDRGDELQRQLHTLKGNAFTYQQPVLGEFIHDLEKFLIKSGGLNGGSTEEGVRILKESLLFARELVLAIREQRPANLKCLDLMRAMARPGVVGKTQAPGPTNPPQTALQTAPAIVPAPREDSETLRRDGISTRIPDHKLDRLESHFREMLRVKNRLGHFSRMLSAEFPEESFPVELRKIHEELALASSELMEFFIDLRRLPIARIRDLLVRIIMEASEKLQREVDFDLELDERETIDGAILGCVETVLVHTVRNAMDHGFAERERGNRLWISAKRSESGGMELRIRDNGRGIDTDSLIKKVLSTGMVDEKTISRMPVDRLPELVFIDGLSTRAEADEFSGRGVGLGVVKSEVEKLGGGVSVQSEAGKGTEFVIRLPGRTEP
jgi:chemotaxis protein histidine kinase CheA